LSDTSECKSVERVVSFHDSGLLTLQERNILLKRDCDGMTYSQIAEQYKFTKQYAQQVYNKAHRIMESGERPKQGRPKAVAMEFVLKLTPRQVDALKNPSLQKWIVKAESESAPYWTFVLSDVLEQIESQNQEQHNPSGGELWD
jgi:hypothetical protein